MRTARSLALALLALVVASCGSSSEPRAAREPEPAARAEPTAEEKLEQAQVSAVHALCERQTDCAVEDAKRSMTPEQIAELDLEKTVPANIAQCEADVGRSSLSPRQIKVIQRCVNEAAECAALASCLDAANKQ